MVDLQAKITEPKPFASNVSRYATAVVIMSLLILCTTIWWPVDGATSASMAERISKMDALFGALPNWVLQWMSVQRFIMLGCLWFVFWHAEARVYMLATLLSHVISYTEIAYAPVERLSLGLVSLNHLTWIPALVLMAKNCRSVDWKSSYGLWYALALFQLVFSLIFDMRDSAIYLAQQYF